MFKLTLLVAVLVCLTYSQEGADWTRWNNMAVLYPTLIQYAQPSLPSNYTRYVDNAPGQPTFNARQNQYRYTYRNATSGATCNIFCGLRSFLTFDQNGNPICERDMSLYFWGSFGTKYLKNCIPDIDNGLGCNQVSPSLSAVRLCNTASYLFTPYKNYGCCFDDNNNNVVTLTDIMTKIKSTTLKSLRNTEP